MNKELIEKFSKEAISEITTKDGALLLTPVFEKFAELIVRECISEIEFQYFGGRELEDGTHSPDWDEAIECVSAMVRFRFGLTKDEV